MNTPESPDDAEGDIRPFGVFWIVENIPQNGHGSPDDGAEAVQRGVPHILAATVQLRNERGALVLQAVGGLSGHLQGISNFTVRPARHDHIQGGALAVAQSQEGRISLAACCIRSALVIL